MRRRSDEEERYPDIRVDVVKRFSENMRRAMSLRFHHAFGLALAMTMLAVAPGRAFEPGDDQYPNSIIAPEHTAHRLPPKYKPHARVLLHPRSYGLATPYRLTTPPASHSYASAPLNLPTVGQPSGPTIVPGLAPVPNMAPTPGVGRETFQDRASRCAHQGALYGVPNTAGSQYMSACAM
jgi:hypothetical protein